ncbi:hypothetical protein OAK19_02550 [Aureispira]|nr:hypothetical protein [Aureispira sp.]
MAIIFYNYFLFRLKQLFRVLKDIGVANILLLLPVIIIFILGALQHILTSNNVSAALCLLFLITSIHFTRKDRFFLEQLKAPLFLFFLLDYIIICCPGLACFIFWGKWYNLLGIGIGTLILSLIRPTYASNLKRNKLTLLNLKWIPISLFECRSGFRKNIIGFICLYFSGIFLSYYPIALPIVLFIMALGISSFFHVFENKDLLLAVNRNMDLLPIKSFGSLKMFNLLMLPHYILFVIQHNSYQYLLFLMVICILSQFIIVFSICMKYKSYRFNAYKLYSSLPLAIFIGTMCIPFLWPITIIMLIQYWKKAQENLSHHYA